MLYKTSLIFLLFMVGMVFQGCPPDDDLNLITIPRGPRTLLIADEPNQNQWINLPDSSFTLVDTTDNLLFYSEIKDTIGLHGFVLEDLCIRQGVKLTLLQGTARIADLIVSMKSFDDGTGCTWDTIACTGCTINRRVGSNWFTTYPQ